MVKHMQLKSQSFLLVSILLTTTLSLGEQSTSWRSFPGIQQRADREQIQDDGADDVRILFIPGFIHFLTRLKSDLTYSHGPFLNHDLRARSFAFQNELETLCHHDSSFYPFQICGQILQLYNSRHYYHKNIFDGPILADIATELAKSLEVDGVNEIGDEVATWLRRLAGKESVALDISSIHSKTAIQINEHCLELAKKVNMANLCNLIETAHESAFLHEDIFQMEGTFLSTIVNIIVLSNMYGNSDQIHFRPPTTGSPTPAPKPAPTTTEQQGTPPTPKKHHAENSKPTSAPTPFPTPAPTYTNETRTEQQEESPTTRKHHHHPHHPENNKPTPAPAPTTAKQKNNPAAPTTTEQKKNPPEFTKPPTSMSPQMHSLNPADLVSKQPVTKNYLHVRTDVEAVLSSKEAEQSEKERIISNCGKALEIPVSRIQIKHFRPTFDYKGLDIMLIILEEPGKESSSSLRGKLKEQVYDKNSVLRKEIPHLFVTELP